MFKQIDEAKLKPREPIKMGNEVDERAFTEDLVARKKEKLKQIANI